LDAAGNLTWVKQMGTGSGTGSAGGSSIAIDGSGNIYTLGNFIGTVDFDPGPGVFNLNSSGCAFICKLDAAGNLLWAKQLDPRIITSPRDRSIGTDASGNLYITGSFYGMPDFDPGPGVFNLTSGGSGLAREMFVCKLNAAGDFLWAKHMGGTGETDYADSYAIAVELSGNVYTTGGFGGTIDFDPGAGVSTISEPVGGTFISKIDASGNFTWVRELTAGTAFALGGGALALDGMGDIFAADGYILFKLDLNGNSIWTKQGQYTGDVFYSSLATDVAGNVYTIGDFYNTINFYPELCPFAFTATGQSDIFISKVNQDSTLAWAKKLSGPGDERGNSIAVDASGNVYTTGAFLGTVDFDPGVPVYDLTSGVGYNAFVHKMSPCASSSSTLKISSCSNYTLNCKTYTTTGVYTQTIETAEGCDSIITLDLTIVTNNARSTANVTACGSYEWASKTFTTSGIYTDTFHFATSCDSIATLNLTINPLSSSNITQTICAGHSYEGYTKTGTYIDTLVAANGCDSIRTIQLTVEQQPAPDLGADKNICRGDTLSLYPGEYTSYLWQDGSTQSHYTANSAGLYTVTVSNQCGSAHAQIVLTGNVCNAIFPSAFSPNKDGKNETFKILEAPGLSDYELAIFNRWGQKIFETRDYTKGWDGNINGQSAATGVYAWFCKFKKPGDASITAMKGTVVLIR